MPKFTPKAMPWWLPTIVVVVALLMTTGGIIALVNPALLVPQGERVNTAVSIYSGYLFSRNVAIALMLIVTLCIRARGALGYFMVLTGLTQLLDAGVDCAEQRWTLVPVVLILGFALLLGAARVLERPWWNIAAWREPIRN
jgi:hypothetical protein